ncbi:hypothetical protein EON73_02430 [bacterium]|nr:MAG: hypothetical protein EON73_02430 [bacterium]
MWTAIIFIVSIAIIRATYDYFKLQREVRLQGGMDYKYRQLIDLLMSTDKRCKIYSKNKTAITLGLVVIGGYTRFEIIQGFGVVIVTLKQESNVFGALNLKWEFHEKMYQDKMYEKVCLDIAKSQNTIN